MGKVEVKVDAIVALADALGVQATQVVGGGMTVLEEADGGLLRPLVKPTSRRECIAWLRGACWERGLDAGRIIKERGGSAPTEGAAEEVAGA
jgi:hypothetical protein